MSLIRTIQFEIDGDFTQSDVIWLRFLQNIHQLSVVVLGTLKHDFPGGGFTGLVLLAESHAAIHTYPEQNRAWVELATCGNPADLTTFHDLMQRLSHLHPERA